MEAAGGVFATSNSSSRLPAFFPSINPKPSLFLREYLHWHAPFPSCQVVHFQLVPKSSSTSVRNRRDGALKRNHAMGRSSQEEEKRVSQESPSGKRPNQKRLLALFKRIETSIAQGKSGSSKSSKDDNASFQSVLEALQQSGRSRKGRTSKKEGERMSDGDSRVSETEKEPSSPDPRPPVDFKLTRPPSNFMRKSPIPSPSIPRISSIELNADEIPNEGVDQVPPELEKMRLTELKELAKARGIKGYSKVKKSELVDLLYTQAKS